MARPELLAFARCVRDAAFRRQGCPLGNELFVNNSATGAQIRLKYAACSHCTCGSPIVRPFRPHWRARHSTPDFAPKHCYSNDGELRARFAPAHCRNRLLKSRSPHVGLRTSSPRRPSRLPLPDRPHVALRMRRSPGRPHRHQLVRLAPSLSRRPHGPSPLYPGHPAPGRLPRRLPCRLWLRRHHR